MRFMYVCAQVGMGVHVLMRRRWTSSLPCVLRQGSSLKLQLTDCTGWPATSLGPSLGPPVSASLVLGTQLW